MSVRQISFCRSQANRLAGVLLFALVSAPRALYAENAAKRPPTIDGFVLVNADTGQDLKQLAPESTLDLSQLPTRRLNIRADASAGVSKVFFQFKDSDRYRTETSRPFALGGDKAGRYLVWTPKIGSQRITATPYTGSLRGQSVTLNLNVVNGSTDATGDVLGMDQPPLVRESEKMNDPTGVEKDGETATPGSPTWQARGALAIHEVLPDAAAADRNTQPVAPASEDLGKCVGMVGTESSELTVVCSHQIDRPLRAQVLQPAANNIGGDEVLCEFLNVTSPIVTSCATNPLTRSALRRGELIVSVERSEGDRIALPVHTK